MGTAADPASCIQLFHLKEIAMKAIATRLAIAAFALMAVASAQAQVTVKDAWVRTTMPEQRSTGAFMQLQAVVDSKLVGVSSAVAQNAAIHEMAMEHDSMTMREVSSVALPAGKTVELKPGGIQVMLIGLKQPLKEGETVPLTLVFEDKDGKRQSVEVSAAVRPRN